jgi:beta-galactosidase
MMRKYCISLFAVLVCMNISLSAQYIKVQKDDKGWRLLDGSTPVEVKGVVWSYTPIGETYSYDLWSHTDEYVKLMIDTDMPLLKAMGVNVIRCFSTIPPEWVEYIYSKYGIYTIINDMLGRYGVSVNGTWYPNTDYSDKYTREMLVEEARKTAETYRAVNGVLMYMFGNESNYGLVWSGSNIENLPAGEQSIVKAGYLYSLLEEAMAACKDIDPFHPVGIVNGDTQYLDLIKKLCPSLDILGVNAYRGYKFYDSFFENIADVLDKPVMFTESGADAFNELKRLEDQNEQMAYLNSQWQEIYEQSYGKGRSQNVIGGFVFEWIDEWWKHYQNKDLSVHNTEGTWSNAGYELDYRDGLNNMDEEWFGICAQSQLTDRGINKRIPRAAYYMLSDVWKLSLYDSTNADVQRTFAALPTSLYLGIGNEQSVKETFNERSMVKIDTLDTTVQTVTPCYVNDLKGSGWKDAFRYTNSDGDIDQMTTSAEMSLGVTVQPFEDFTASAVLKAWTDAPYTNLGDEWSSYYKKAAFDQSTEPTQTASDLQYVDVYSASFDYEPAYFGLKGYYHVGHGNFETSGDVFNIAKEAYDIIGYDTYGSKAPVALELDGKGLFSGLTVISGPEIWGSAKPQVMANYYHTFTSSSVYMPLCAVGAMYTEEFGPSTNINLDPYNGFGPGRKASLYGEAVLDPWVTVKLGVLNAGSEKVGAKYLSSSGASASITWADTLGGYAQIGTNMFQHMYIYTNAIYRGLVTDTNAATVRGSFYTADSGAGNRFEMQAGVDAGYGDFVFKPVFRARVPLQKAMGRSLLSGSPFIVGLGNRQALEVEAVLTFDPEGATWFHEWNSDDIEGARFAASLTGLYTLYAGKTDIIPYKSSDWTTATNSDGTIQSGYVWYAPSNGLPEQRNLWQGGTRIVTNPVPRLRLIGTFEGGQLGSTTGEYTDTEEIVSFWKAGLSFRYGRWIGGMTYWADCWGPETWWRNFNQTFPVQYSFDIAYAFRSNPSFLDSKNRVGLKVAGRVYGENSSDPYGALPAGVEINGASYMEITTYFNIGL